MDVKNKLSPLRMLRPVNIATEGFEEVHGNAVVCPICGFEYVHVDRSGVESVDFYGKGGALLIPMYCENGHRWNLVIDQHKGWCFMTITNPHIISPIEEGEWK